MHARTSASAAASLTLTLSGEPLPPPLALASRILFDGLFDRMDHETFGHGHHFVSRAASARCAVRLLVDAAAGLEQMRAAWAGRDDELTPGILEASLLRLFPFFTADHMAAVRSYAVGGGLLDSAADAPAAPTSPLRPSRYAVQGALHGVAGEASPSAYPAEGPPSPIARRPCTTAESSSEGGPPSVTASATARVERSLLGETMPGPGRALTGAGSTPSTMLPPLRPTETPARALGLRLPRTQFVEVGSPAQDPGLVLASPFSPTRRARPPAPAPRYMTDETGVVRWRSGAVVHSRMVPCQERVVVLGQHGHLSPLYLARFEVPHRLFLIRARPSAAGVAFKEGGCALFESYLELWPGLVGLPPRPELVGFRCDDPCARFVLVATEPSQGVSRRIELLARPGPEPVWEVPEPGGVLDMRRFARLVLVVEVALDVNPSPLPEMWVHVCALGRLACVSAL